ncbi:PQQ-containing dehydrogenase 2 [Ameyamaea chiangmaiensis NBRC 103196]|nr:PQQ-like beta-propeller repeat protein [Ameyamaea chiangmaiensis]GBQ63164.1 PQQ-containing dehydrogenase 2 [Ameyamaea chiangmaiensis NBRC 103196]
MAGIGLPVALGGCHLFEDDDKPILAGHRVNVLSTGDGLTVDPDEHTPITVPAPVAVPEWREPGGTPTHVGINAALNGRTLQWSRRIGAGVSEPSFLSYIALGSTGRGAIGATPIVGDGRLFVMDAQGVVSAWSWPAMGRLWAFSPKPHKMQSSNIGGGLALSGDTLYIVDGVAETVAVEAATGKVRWRMDFGTPGRSAPTVVDGRVFFGTIDERLFALDAATGAELWRYSATQADTVFFGQPAPAVIDGIVAAGFGSGDLVALRADSGEMVWSDALGSTNGRAAVMDFSCVRGMPVAVDRTIYAISVASVMVAIDARSGRRLWERAVGGQCTPLVLGDWIYILSSDQQVACLDRYTGRVRWISQLRRFVRVNVSKNAMAWTGPIMAGSKLICISTLPSNGIAVLDPATGKIESVEPLPGISTVMPIVVDGRMLVLTDDGKLNAFG